MAWSVRARRVAVPLWWLGLVVLSGYYLQSAVRYRFGPGGTLGPTLWNKQAWYVLHLATAVLPLVLGPLQFSRALRARAPAWHRGLGRAYLLGSLGGALTALYLGLTIDLEGSIVPLALLASLWLFTIGAAWWSIRQGNVVVHRQFAIRSYTCALVFVLLRVLDDVGLDRLFPFIHSQPLRETTHEWLSWVLPVLLVELAIAWLPALRGRGVRHGDARDAAA